MPSRWITYAAPDDMLCDAFHRKARLDSETVHTPLHVGTMRCRGFRGGLAAQDNHWLGAWTRIADE